MIETPIGDPKAKCLIDGLNAIQLKWSNMDPTTISSGFQYDKIKSYQTLRQHHQIGCRESASKYSITELSFKEMK